MSTSPLRRYRAERLLRSEFDGLRSRVLAIVRARLRARGVSVDAADLEDCYAQAWQGLYAALLEGEEISNPTGWLALVSFRRAIDEHRWRVRERADYDGEPAVFDLDLAGELDDRARLRQVFEGLRGRLSARECQAAALCYLQGLTRAEAAARMGISESRMRKLMEGQGSDRPGVAGKVGELLQTIRDGGWCEQQSSLMRGLAFGILDPDGERYRLAVAHRRECPACRAYIMSLRGLAAMLPPVSLPGVLGAGAAAGAGGALGAGAVVGAGAGSGALQASGLGGTSGGWLAAGGKLALGGVLVLGAGTGWVVLRTGAVRPPHPVASTPVKPRPAIYSSGPLGVPSPQPALAAHPSEPRSTRTFRGPLAVAREFGPERTPSSTAPAVLGPGTPRAAGAEAAPAVGTGTTPSGSIGTESGTASESATRAPARASRPSREFGFE